jgi:hypothetical protein
MYSHDRLSGWYIEREVKIRDLLQFYHTSYAGGLRIRNLQNVISDRQFLHIRQLTITFGHQQTSRIKQFQVWVVGKCCDSQEVSKWIGVNNYLFRSVNSSELLSNWFTRKLLLNKISIQMMICMMYIHSSLKMLLLDGESV